MANDQKDRKPTASKYKDLGELQDLLIKACPKNDDGRQSLSILAAALGVSHQYVYKWIENKKVPPRYVPEIVELSKGAVTVEDFHIYVFGTTALTVELSSND